MRKALENIDVILDCSPYSCNNTIFRTKDGLEYTLIIESLRFKFLCKYDGSIWFGWNESTSNNIALKQYKVSDIKELFNHVDFIVNSVREL